MQPDLFLAIGSMATVFAGMMFYCASVQQRLFAQRLSGSMGVGGGALLTLCAVVCFTYIMSLTTALFMTVVLLMLWLCFLPPGIALVKSRGEQR